MPIRTACLIVQCTKVLPGGNADLDETTVILTGCSQVAFDAQDFWDTFKDAERDNPNLHVILFLYNFLFLHYL